MGALPKGTFLHPPLGPERAARAGPAWSRQARLTWAASPERAAAPSLRKRL